MLIIENIFLLFGGLGFFFFGMRQFSDALQSMSSTMIKKILDSITANRILGVLTGLFLTTLVQSSSITTVMIVGLVNAGLLELTQAISVIFGANIGTTITGWIIAVKIGKYGVHMVGAGAIPMLFMKGKANLSGKFLFGLGLVFIGLETMSDTFKPLRKSELFHQTMLYFDASTLLSILACVLIGCILTIIVQSSSAMLGITIALASTGAISFQTAAALVFGENIGTTITALLASIGTNTNAKRVAIAHTLFNATGVLVIVFVFPYWVQMVDYFVPGLPDSLSTDGSKPFVAAHIAFSHTSFNVAATLIFLPFIHTLTNITKKIIPDSKTIEEEKLEFFVDPSSTPPVIAIAEAFEELKRVSILCKQTLEHTEEYVCSQSANPQLENYVMEMEKKSDKKEAEVAIFLSRLMERELPEELVKQLNSFLKINREMEGLMDQCRHTILRRKQLFENNYDLDEEDRRELNAFFHGIRDIYELVLEQLDGDKITQVKFEKIFKSLKKESYQMRDHYLEKVRVKNYSPLSWHAYSDMIIEQRKIMGHIASLNRGLNECVL